MSPSNLLVGALGDAIKNDELSASIRGGTVVGDAVRLGPCGSDAISSPGKRARAIDDDDDDELPVVIKMSPCVEGRWEPLPPWDALALACWYREDGTMALDMS